jgi:hypothetical protein
LWFRHGGQSIEYNWGTTTGQNDGEDWPAKLQWAAFYSDCEHEVMEVTSGNRVTITSNLYAVPQRTECASDSVEVDLSMLPLYKALEEAKNDDMFLPQGSCPVSPPLSQSKSSSRSLR